MGARALACSTQWKVLTATCPFQTLRRYFTPLHVIWFSSGRDTSRVKFLAMLQAAFEPACKHSEAQLVGLFSWYAKPL